VIDTLVSFAKLKEGQIADGGPMTELLMDLKSLFRSVPGLAIVVLHHCRIENQSRGGDFRIRRFSDIAGSYALRASSDQNILLFAADEQNDPRTRTVKIEGRFEMGAVDGFDIRLSADEQDYELAPIGMNFGASLQKEKLHLALEADPSIAELSERDLAEKVGVSRHQAREWRKGLEVVDQPK
jgi:hypothetical protein